MSNKQGKTARAKAKNNRDAKKKARKLAQQRQYEEWARLGINTKSKRAKLNAKRGKKKSSIDHPDGPCGNIGCRKCNPAEYNLLTPWQLHLAKAS